MDKEDILRLVDNPNFIPGIFNYCDRWCERCSFTSSCANYAYAELKFPNKAHRDMRNEQFWNKLQDVFQTTLEMLLEDTQSHGFDLSAANLSQETPEERQRQLQSKTHPCVISAKEYSKKVDDWFESATALFTKKGDKLELNKRLDLPGNDPDKEMAILEDAIEVVRWYQYQIHVKLRRAIDGKLEEILGSSTDNSPKDSDGSAKVALLGMDSSIGAWGTFLENFPKREDEILEILVDLERLRGKTELEFPNARHFIRPGFDEDKQPLDDQEKLNTESKLPMDSTAKMEISKNEVNELDIFRYEGEIVLVTRPEEIAKVMPEIMDEKVIGFDTETRPSFRKGVTHSVSLLQIATSRKVYLFRLKETGISNSLRLFFESKNITKVGVAIRDDLLALKEFGDFEENNVVDLNDYFADRGYISLGVRKLTALILGVRVSKRQQTSNWEAFRLKPAQMVYAATDAWVCREIYLKTQAGEA